MSHFPKPFFRKSRNLWYVQVGGKQHNLGPDRDRAFEIYYQLMQRRPCAERAAASDSVVAIIDLYLEWCEKNRAPATYDWYQPRLQSFVLSISPNLTVSQLRPFHVQAWVDNQPGWASGSKRNGCRAVQRAMRWAEQQGYIDRSPIAHMQKPPAGKREVVISEAEFGRIVGLIPDPELLDLLQVTWHAGCRPQESLRVEARHVDLRGSRWVIPVSEAKTDLVRGVYLNDEATAITKRRMLRFPTGPLFRNSRGRGWTTDAVNNAMERVQIRMGFVMMKERKIAVTDDEIKALIPSLKRNRFEKGVSRPKRAAELRHEAKRKLRKKLARSLAPRYCLYHIRHTWMDRLLKSGVDAMTVAILAGHSDPSMLAKTYQHLSQSPDFLLQQVKRLAG